MNTEKKPRQVTVLGYDAKTGICAVKDDELGLLTVRCEPMRSKNENQTQQKIQRGETIMELQMTAEQRNQIISHKRGQLNGGGAVHQFATKLMAVGEKDYRTAIRKTYAIAENGEAEAEVARVKDRREFARRTHALMSQWNIPANEAARRVADSIPRLAIYASDPMGPIEVVGTTEPRPTADITNPVWTPSVRMTDPVQQIGVTLLGLPRDEWGEITLEQCAQALKPYPDRLDQAAGDVMNAYAMALIDILGLHGFKSDNFPIAYEEAKRRYPSLKALLGGRLSSQALIEMYPHLPVRD